HTSMLMAGAGFSFFDPDRSRVLGNHATRDTRQQAVVAGLVGTGRLTDDFGETGTERTKRGPADLEAHVGDAEVAAPQQRHRTLEPACHQVAVRRLAEGFPEAAREVPCR